MEEKALKAYEVFPEHSTVLQLTVLTHNKHVSAMLLVKARREFQACVLSFRTYIKEIRILTPMQNPICSLLNLKVNPWWAVNLEILLHLCEPGHLEKYKGVGFHAPSYFSDGLFVSWT